MSYIQFRQRCRACESQWNAAFGIIGTTYIAEPPAKCPRCGSDDLVKIADGWSNAMVGADGQ